MFMFLLSATPSAASFQPLALIGSRWRLFANTYLVTALNPKGIVFFVAFLPQFIDPSRGAVAVQVAFLGVLFAAIALTSDAMYALVADLLAGKLRRSGAGARLRRWVSGGIFIALGVTAATARRAS